MAIEIRETFEVAAPIERVWTFVMDPHKVAACMPGAALEEVVDEKTFLGNIKVKVGAVTASYKGRVEMVEIDAPGFRVQMRAEGRETGGGTARGTMTSRLEALPGGGTQIVAEATVDLTGRIMQMGRGMIQGVSHQLFLQFVKRAREALEIDSLAGTGDLATATAVQPGERSHERAGEGARRGGVASSPQVAGEARSPAAHDDAIRVIPLLLAALRTAVVRFFRRLFGGRAETEK